MVQYPPLRLTAYSLRTIKAVWNSYNDFTTWFSKANTYDSRTSKECNTFTSLTFKYFIAKLALMYDCLNALASFSLLLQSNSINFKKAHNKVFQNHSSNGALQKQVWILRKSDNLKVLWY